MSESKGVNSKTQDIAVTDVVDSKEINLEELYEPHIM